MKNKSIFLYIIILVLICLSLFFVRSFSKKRGPSRESPVVILQRLPKDYNRLGDKFSKSTDLDQSLKKGGRKIESFKDADISDSKKENEIDMLGDYIQSSGDPNIGHIGDGPDIISHDMDIRGSISESENDPMEGPEAGSLGYIGAGPGADSIDSVIVSPEESGMRELGVGKDKYYGEGPEEN